MSKPSLEDVVSKGDFISQRVYYGHKVLLYRLEVYLVETHYSQEKNKIQSMNFIEWHSAAKVYKSKTLLLSLN
jgi:hypothetical protein